MNSINVGLRKLGLLHRKTRWRAALVRVLLIALSLALPVPLRAMGITVDGVAFEGRFPTPLCESRALKSDSGAEVQLGLRIFNRTGRPLRFSDYDTILPELVNRAGAVVPFEFGNNPARLPRVADYPLLPPGRSLVLPLEATLMLRTGQLEWHGSDGTAGLWNVVRAEAPYRLRLHYRQTDATVGPLEKDDGVLHDLWVGEARTKSVEVPLGLD
jgi:hypothetical protein